MNAPMNRQEVFNRVVAHARAQPLKSLSDTGALCMYRGAPVKVDGKVITPKCFIGALIPDNVYEEGMEGGLHALLNKFHPVQALFDGSVSTGFLQDLQTIHDAYPPSEWEHQLYIFAFGAGLDFPERKGVPA